MENYKQKYEAALGQAKQELKACGSLDCDAARQIFRLFPELKEFKESNIISALKFAVTYHLSVDHGYVANIPKGQLIAWLEKQGEQKLTDEPKQQWSCEDENMFACLWGILNWVEKSNYSSAKNMGKYIEWLQSLKQRLNGYE